MKFSVYDLNGDQLQSFIDWVNECPEERKIEVTIEAKASFSRAVRDDLKITTRAWDGREMASQYGFNHADEIDIKKAVLEHKREELKRLQAELGDHICTEPLPY